MRVLLIEPDCQRPPRRKNGLDDETLWYPPLALMKLARFHCDRGDEFRFVRGINKSVLGDGAIGPLFPAPWDRVYITTLFTFHFDKIVRTINFYKEAVGGTTSKVYVGGIMATLMPDEIREATNIRPVESVLFSSKKQLGLGGGKQHDTDVNIDQLAPLYKGFDKQLYAINDTFYAYTSRGCVNQCPWCGVPTLEPEFVPYIDIKPAIRQLRDEEGDFSTLKLMDNNVLASDRLDEIVDDLLELGFGRDAYTETNPQKKRVVDFNQGLDATFVTEEKMELLSQLNVRPMRIAFDHVKQKKEYERAIGIAHKYEVHDFSNYMLYNFRDTPRDLYERLVVNIRFNEKWAKEDGTSSAKIYSYPMRYAPIVDKNNEGRNRQRDYVYSHDVKKCNWLEDPKWTRRFVRNVEIMKGAAHGAISPTPTLAWRTIGKDFREYVANLYMPEELLRNRNKHERKAYSNDPNNKPGTGKIEEFREFILDLLEKQDGRFEFFHNAVSPNQKRTARECLEKCTDKELSKWIEMYA